MAEKVVSLTAALDKKRAEDRDPEHVKLGELTTAAMQLAGMTAANMIMTLGGRQLRKGDVTKIARAIESGWEIETFRIMGDESLSPRLRGIAATVWEKRRATIVAAAANMARALVAPS